jgi:putative tricarboxylic transport membrane protein
MTLRATDKNFLCGLLFILFAVALGWEALGLPIGQASAMGPGYFPLALAVMLALLGVILVIGSWTAKTHDLLTHFEWRGFVTVILAVLVFGATIRTLGFVPAIVLTLTLAILASSKFRPLAAIGTVAFLLVFCWAVFVKGLGMPVRLFW